MRLAVLARRALAADKELAALNLGVKVRDGVATVWGPVPSAALGLRAVRTVEGVRGIASVHSEMQVTGAGKAEELTVTLPPRQPTRTQSASPDRERGELPALVLPTRRSRDDGPGEGLPAMTPARAVPGPRPAVVLGPPAPARPPAEHTTSRAPSVRPAEGLVEAVERVRRAEARFGAVRVEVRGTTVVVHGGEAVGEDVMALAQALRRLRGVQRVLLQDE
jgi:hypothetical protein